MAVVMWLPPLVVRVGPHHFDRRDRPRPPLEGAARQQGEKKGKAPRGSRMDETDVNLRDAAVRQVVTVVAVLNLAYFGIEFGVALAIRSVSLFADSVDFLEDASVNLLILMALRWSARSRARLGMLLAAILLAPALGTLWALWGKFAAPVVPQPIPLSLTGSGALAINLFCALLLARVRHHAGSMTRAAFLSARNDAAANVAIIVAGLLTAGTNSIWPDAIVGIGIAIMNLDAAREVWQAARREHAAAS